MKKNTASQVIGAQMVSATDGSAFTGSVTCYVTGDGGTQAVGSVGSGACTHEGNGYHTYAPAQAETNYDHVAFTFTGSGAVPATVQVYTTFPQTGDNFARLGAPAGASVSADVAAVKSQTAAIETDTQDIQSRLPAALVSGRMASDAIAISGSTTAADNVEAVVTNAGHTADVDISMRKLSILSDAGTAVTIQTEDAGNGITITADTGFGVSVFGATTGAQIYGGDAAGAGLRLIGFNSAAPGMRCFGGLGEAPGILLEASDGPALAISTGVGNAATIASAGGNGHGILITPHGTGRAISPPIDGAVTSIANDAITASAIASNAITDAKIASDALTAAKFASGAFDAVWTVTTRTLSSFESLVSDIWSHGTRLLTAGTNIVLAKGTGVTGFNDLDAAGVRGAVGMAAADMDTQLSGIAVDADAAAGDAAAIKAVTDLLPDAGALTSIAQESTLGPAAASVEDMREGIIFGETQAGTLTTTSATTDLSGYGDDQLIGRVIVFLSSNVEGEASRITDYAASGGLATFDALTTAPNAGALFKIV